MLSPLPRHGDWRHCIAHPSSHISLPRKGLQVGPCIVLFEACSVFTHVTACTLALPPYFVARLTEGFNHFVTSIVAPVASGWSKLPGGAFTHWKSAAFARRTPRADIRGGKVQTI
jgi:hypothetical protein